MHHAPSSPNSDKRLAALMRVQSDYTQWFNGTIASAFYGSKHEYIPQPESFGLWMRAAQMEGVIRQKRIRAMHDASEHVQECAKRLVDSIKENDKDIPERGAFNALNYSMERLYGQLRDLLKISVLEDRGIDHLTGLYSPTAMHTAFKVEMDRLARRGHSFVIALAQIDNYDHIAEISDEDHSKAMTIVANEVKSTLRVYDDAYRSGDGEFVLCLKQADIHAGTAAMDRLHENINKQNINFEMPDGRNVKLTVTSCLIAPLAGDSFDEILPDLRRDLKNTQQDPGSVVTHHEVSPLGVWVQEQEEIDSQIAKEN